MNSIYATAVTWVIANMLICILLIFIGVLIGVSSMLVIFWGAFLLFTAFRMDEHYTWINYVLDRTKLFYDGVFK